LLLVEGNCGKAGVGVKITKDYNKFDFAGAGTRQWDEVVLPYGRTKGSTGKARDGKKRTTAESEKRKVAGMLD